MFDEQPDGDPHGECAAEINKLRAALLACARQAESLKRECGMDSESAQAMRNAQYQAISTTATAAAAAVPARRSWSHPDGPRRFVVLRLFE